MDIMNAGRVGLLELPTEARLRIYRQCFDTKDHQQDTDWVKIDVQTGRRPVKTHIWPLFQVCKQMYSEIMPEYYASTVFHFNALAHLREMVSSHQLFKTYARHLVLNPHFSVPTVEDLLALPNLHTFAIANIVCSEPIGTVKGTALSYSTLKRVIDVTESIAPGLQPVKPVLALRDSMVQNAELCRRKVHLLLRFRYSYVEKALHPDGWGGSSAKRQRLIDYDFNDDRFILLQPDPEENSLIEQ